MSYKIGVIGDAGVGKSNFIKRLQGNNFSPRYIPNTSTKITRINSPTSHIKMELCEFPGKDIF